MKKSLSKAAIAILVALSVPGCNPGTLPDPTVEYPTPPEALMNAPQEMNTIPLENTTLDR